MAEWTDPASLIVVPAGAGDPPVYVRSADWNKMVNNFEFLANPPQTVVRLTSSQEVASGTNHTVTWDTSVWSDNGETMWDDTAPTKIIITREGTYDINARVLWDAATDGTKRSVGIWVNGEKRVETSLPAVDPTEMECNLLRTNMALDDEVEIVVRHLNGDPLDMLATRTRCTVAWATQPPTGEA